MRGREQRTGGRGLGSQKDTWDAYYNSTTRQRDGKRNAQKGKSGKNDEIKSEMKKNIFGQSSAAEYNRSSASKKDSGGDVKDSSKVPVQLSGKETRENDQNSLYPERKVGTDHVRNELDDRACYGSKIGINTGASNSEMDYQVQHENQRHQTEEKSTTTETMIDLLNAVITGEKGEKDKSSINRNDERREEKKDKLSTNTISTRVLRSGRKWNKQQLDEKNEQLPGGKTEVKIKEEVIADKLKNTLRTPQNDNMSIDSSDDESSVFTSEEDTILLSEDEDEPRTVWQVDKHTDKQVSKRKSENTPQEKKQKRLHTETVDMEVHSLSSEEVGKDTNIDEGSEGDLPIKRKIKPM